MKTWLLAVIAVVACLSSCLAQDLKDMNFLQLRTNCWFEIERGNGSQLIDVKIIDLKVLAWYRLRDSRAVYVDNALCWAKTSTSTGSRWFLVHMARNPVVNSTTADPVWRLYFVTDTSSSSWFLDLDRPPTNEDIYNRMKFFNFSIDADWTLYDSKIMEEDWKIAIGEAPAEKFSIKPVQRTGANQNVITGKVDAIPAIKQATTIREEDAVAIAKGEAKRHGWREIHLESVSFEKGYWLIFLARNPEVFGADGWVRVSTNGTVISFSSGK